MLSKSSELQLLNSKEVVSLLGMSERWLRQNRTSRNRIPFVRFGRKIYYEKTDLIDWIKKQKITDLD